MWPFGPSRRELEQRVIRLETELRQTKFKLAERIDESARLAQRNRQLEGQLQAALRANTAMVNQVPPGKLVPALSRVANPPGETRADKAAAWRNQTQGRTLMNMTNPPTPRIATEEAVATQVLPIVTVPPVCESPAESSGSCASNSCGGSSSSCGGSSSSCGASSSCGGGGD